MSFENKTTSTPLPCKTGLKQQNEEFYEEVEALKKLLEEQKASEEAKNKEIMKLRDTLANLRLTSREMQEALTIEVADKHDTLVALRREMAQLEEQVRQSDMQTQFKDDIIKGLRKEVKIARAKESFVEMLGLNGNPRVIMKGEIDRLKAEVEERSAEVAALQAQLKELHSSKLEAQLAEVSSRLAERDKDLIAMCNKIDYVKRYIEKLHNDEDLSVKCGMEALLHELNEDSEWRRQARRSVTSLSEQPPDSVIIINRSYSLPTDTSQGIPHYQSGRGVSDSNNAEVAKLKAKITELEAALDKAKGQVFDLDRTIQEMARELAAAGGESSCKWYSFPDASISSKFEDFQNSVDDSSRKMELMVSSMKQNDVGELVLSDIEDCQQFLGIERDKLDGINVNLMNLLKILKSTKGQNSENKQYKIECLEHKLQSLMKKIRRMSCESSYPDGKRDDESEKEHMLDEMVSKLDEIMMGMQELKSDFSVDENFEPDSPDGSIVIRNIICEVKSSISDVKRQENKMSNLSDMLRCEYELQKKNMLELSQLVAANGEDLSQIKQELKLAICETTNAADQVKKRTENLISLEDTINAIQQVLCSCELSMGDPEELKKLLDTLVYEFKKIISSTSPFSDKCKKCENGAPRHSKSTPQLGYDSSRRAADINSFEDKCYAAQALCNEIKKEFDSVNCKLNQKHMKLVEMGERLNKFESQVQCAMKKIDMSFDMMQDTSGAGYCTAIQLLEDVNRNLIKLLQRISDQLRRDQCKMKDHEQFFMISRKVVDSKMDELDCTLNEVSEIISRMHDGGYEKMSSKCKDQDESVNDSKQKLVEEISQLKKMIKCHEQTIKEYKLQIGCMNSEMTKRDFEVCKEMKILAAEKKETETENERVKRELQAKICDLQANIQRNQASSSVGKHFWSNWIYRQKIFSPHIHDV